MVKKYVFGSPFNTESVVQKIPLSRGAIPFGKIQGHSSAFIWTHEIDCDAQVFGLGSTMRGIDKRGGKFVSFNTDQPDQVECTQSLYGSHNFLIVFGKETFGVFFDYPGRMEFDIAFSNANKITVSAEKKDISLYFFIPPKKDALNKIVQEFRALTGKSYIPPKWAFGFCQSRWGYKNKKDILEVYQKYRALGFPLDSICMDIDYMENYKDFTVDPKKFPAFKNFVESLKKDGVRLVPIIDAGIKKEAGYSVYEECVQNKFACTKKDGSTFVGGVWPGDSVFTDFLNPDARKWFGKKYRALTECGIEGFWNDMNEPALFYTPEGLKKAFKKLEGFKNRALDVTGFFEFMDALNAVKNSTQDYKSFYHRVENTLVNHYDVHNLYGFNMTRGAAEAFSEDQKERRVLLYSRSSFVGAHRYGGIWTGDNHAYWGDILLSLSQMASLNMTGFLYSGSDTGGFNADTSRDLLLRWTAFSIWTPLFRNHSAFSSASQEFYQFERPEDFRSMVLLRYALIPYLYSEFVKAAMQDKMYFKPLSFDFPKDKRACRSHDQILLGGEVMLAPVYVQNARGRYVYLPEEMTRVEWNGGKIVSQKKLSKGDHWISVPENSVVFFVRKGKKIPLARPALCVEKIDANHFTFAGKKDASYLLYDDDGFSTNITLRGHLHKI